jgi:hypothetical protein
LSGLARRKGTDDFRAFKKWHSGGDFLGLRYRRDGRRFSCRAPCRGGGADGYPLADTSADFSPNDPESLTHWIANAQAVKPGCRMPALDLSRDDVAAVTSYVQTLL